MYVLNTLNKVQIRVAGSDSGIGLRVSVAGHAAVCASPTAGRGACRTRNCATAAPASRHATQRRLHHARSVRCLVPDTLRPDPS
jgi:hypothetical protein